MPTWMQWQSRNLKELIANKIYNKIKMLYAIDFIIYFISI